MAQNNVPAVKVNESVYIQDDGWAFAYFAATMLVVAVGVLGPVLWIAGVF